MTTGMLQQLVYLQRLPAGSRALIVGAEHVSFSAIMTLAHGGARTVALTTELPRHQSLAAFRLGALARYRVPVWTAHARERDPRPPAGGGGGADRPRGRRASAPSPATPSCSPTTGSPTTSWRRWPAWSSIRSRAARRSTPRCAARVAGVFAAGNVLHGAEQADVAALSGRHAAAGVGALPAATATGPRAGCRCVCEPPLGWIAPNAVPGAEAPAARPLRAARARAPARRRGSRSPRASGCSGAGAWRALMPGRSARLPHDWVREVDPAGEAVVCALRHPGRRRRWSTRSRQRSSSGSWSGWRSTPSEVGEHIDETRRDWEAKEDDPTVPGAQPDPDEEEQTPSEEEGGP